MRRVVRSKIVKGRYSIVASEKGKEWGGLGTRVDGQEKEREKGKCREGCG